MLFATGCDAAAAPESSAATTAESAAAAEAPAAAQAPAHPLGDSAAWRACEEELARVQATPAVAGNPAFEAERAEIVGRVRGATVLWKREPRSDEAAAKSVLELEAAGRPLRAVRDVIHRHRKTPEALRALFLREGYFYVRGVDLAVAAVQQLGLPLLFRAPRLYLLRDGTVHALKRAGRAYVHDGGELDGEDAELLFADRVAEDAAALTADAIAVDFSAAAEAHGFERLRVDHFAQDRLAGAVRYGGADGVWVRAVFDTSVASARLVCQAPAESEAGAVAEAVFAAQRRRDVQAAIRAAALAQVRERLPFDAPRSGGDPADKYPLRARWQDAYARSQRSFRFGGKRYPVYDEAGRPHPPQVCIDYVYDTWERASGTWYAPLSTQGGGATQEGGARAAPKRIAGGLDLDDLALEDRRRVSRFLDYAAAHPETFDAWQVPEADRVVFEKHEPFFAMLAKHADQLRRGDMLVVRRPKAGKLALHHTMIVIEIDLVSGIPALLAGNASRPQVQTFEGVMQTSPKRYLEWRVRPRAEWLDAAILRTLASAKP
jgi:hypothetical protein